MHYFFAILGCVLSHESCTFSTGIQYLQRSSILGLRCPKLVNEAKPTKIRQKERTARLVRLRDLHCALSQITFPCESSGLNKSADSFQLTNWLHWLWNLSKSRVCSLHSPSDPGCTLSHPRLLLLPFSICNAGLDLTKRFARPRVLRSVRRRSRVSSIR
jgi:hypothetical protein